MSLIQQWRDMAAVDRIHGEAMELQVKLFASPDIEERRRIAEQLVALDLAQADHLEASLLARVTSLLPTPDTMRQRAADWRDVAENPDDFR